MYTAHTSKLSELLCAADNITVGANMVHACACKTSILDKQKRTCNAETGSASTEGQCAAVASSAKAC